MTQKSLLTIILTTTLAAGCFFLFKPKNLEEKIITQEEIQYTPKGRIERRTTYDPNIHLTEHITKRYTERKKEESKIIQYQNGAIEIIETPTRNIKITTRYDTEGNQIEKIREEYTPHETSTNYSYITQTFDAEGNQTEYRVEVFNEQDIFIRGFTHFYNKEGQKIKEESIFIENNEPKISEREYKEEE